MMSVETIGSSVYCIIPAIAPSAAAFTAALTSSTDDRPVQFDDQVDR